MGELLFPLAAVALTFLALIPALTLVSRAVLWRKRRVGGAWVDFGSDAVFAWLVLPTLVPVVWLTSSALHQTEASQSTQACLIEHVQVTTCLDAALLVGLLLGGMALSIGVRVYRERPRGSLSVVSGDAELARRVAAVVAGDRGLRRLSVQVARGAASPVFTEGWFRGRTVLDACFVRDADDAMIRAALLHELAHVRAWDTMRDFGVRLCLSVNPAGRLLTGDFERWRAAREALCDSEAVHLGGEPLALAESIVRAARFECEGLASCGVSRLCGHDLTALKLRLALLLSGPARPARSLGHVVLIAAAVAAVVVPHMAPAGVLEHVHFEVERLLHPHL